jgi:serine phosphatase RsbU (regulator of sigma subunit)
MNRLLFEELSSVDMYITAQLVLVEAAQRRLTLSSAGHCPLLLASGRFPTRAVSSEGVPIGILGDAAYAEEVCLLESGFRVLMYTDGLTEARNAEGIAYGQERLQEWLTASRNLNETAGQLQTRLLTEFDQFQHGNVPRDDQTLVVLAEELVDSRAVRQAA